MFFVSIPKAATFSLFVDKATKCFAIADSGAFSKNQRFAEFAFVIVSENKITRRRGIIIKPVLIEIFSLDIQDWFDGFMIKKDKGLSR